MADENKIIYTIGYDQASLNNTRKAIESQLANIQIGIKSQFYSKLTNDISKNVTPKLAFEVDQRYIKNFAQIIQNQIGEIPVSVKIDARSISSVKNQIQNQLGKFDIDVKINALDGRLGNVKKSLNDMAVAFETVSKAKDEFAANVQEKFPKIIGAFNELKLAAKETKEQIQSLKDVNLKATDVKAALKTSNGSSQGRKVDIKDLTANETDKINKTTDAINKLSNAHGRAVSTVANFSERLGFTTTRLAAYLIPAIGIYRLFGAFDTARSSIIDINSEITKLTQVLSNNKEQVDKIVTSAFSLGTAYGTSGKELLQVATELSRINGDLVKNGGLTSTLKAFAGTKFSVGFGNLKETVEGTKDALSQFNQTTKDTADTLDIVASLTKRFDVNAEDLFNAVKSGGASFSQAGGNLKQFIALLTSIKQLTGLPSTAAGNALNTLSFRLQQPELIAFVDRLTDNKVRNADGTLKDIGSRIIEIAKATKNLDDQAVTNVVDKLVGTRQGKILAPLLRDIAKGNQEFSQFGKIIDTINNAPGEIGRNTAIGLKSLDTQLGSLSARFEEVFSKLAQNKGIQELVAQFVSLGKSVAGALEAIGPLLPTLIRIASIRLTVSTFTAIPGITRGLLGLGSTQVRNSRITNGSTIANAPIINQGTPVSTNLSDSLALRRISNLVNTPNQFRVPILPDYNSGVIRRFGLPVLGETPLIRGNGILGPTQATLANAYFNSFLATRANVSPAFSSQQATIEAQRLQARNAIGALGGFGQANTIVPRASIPLGIYNRTFRGIDTSGIPNAFTVIGNGGRTERIGNASLEEALFIGGTRKTGLDAIFSRRARGLDFSGPLGLSNPFAVNAPSFASGNFIGPLTQRESSIRNAIHGPSSDRNLLESGLYDIASEKKVLSDTINVNYKRISLLKQQNVAISETTEEMKGLIQSIKNDRQALNHLTGEEERLVASLRTSESSSIQSSIAQANAKLANSFGGRTNNFLFGDNNIFSRSGRVGRSIIRRAGPDLLAIGGSFAADAAFQHFANNNDVSIVDANGRLKSNFSNVLAANQSNNLGAGIFQGVGTGIALGASVGSAFGPVGTLIGGGIGAIGGGIVGGVNASSEGREKAINALFNAASQANSFNSLGEALAKQSEIIRGTTPRVNGILSNDFLGIPSNDRLIFNAIAPKADFADKFASFLQGPDSDAFQQKIRSLAFNTASSGGVSNVAAVRQNLVSQLSNAFEDQGFGPKKSLSRASDIISETFRKLNEDGGSLDKTLQDVIENSKKLSTQLSNQSDNLELFIHRFLIGTQKIQIGNIAGSIQNQNLSQLSNAAIHGNFGGLQLSDQLGGLLTGRILSGVNSVNANNPSARSIIGRSIEQFSGGFLNDDDQKVIGDIALLHRAITQTVTAISQSFSGQRIDATNAPTFVTRGSQILNDVLSKRVGSQLRSQQGRDDFDRIRQNIGAALGSNPEAFQGNPEKVAEQILNDLNASSVILGRFNSNIDAINVSLATSNQAFKNDLDIRGKVAALDSQALNVGLRGVNRGAALGLNDQDISDRLQALVDTSLGRLNRDNSDFAPTLGLAAANSFSNLPGFTPFADSADSANKLNKSLQELVNTQDKYQIEINKSHDALSLLDAQFQHLNQVLNKQEAANSRVALTPINQRREAERGGFIFNSLTSSFFGPNSPLASIRNPRDLLRLSPAQIASLAKQASNLAGRQDFINSEQSFLSVFGDRQAVGAPSGTTNNDRAKLINLLAGLGTPNLAGGTPDLQQYIRNLKDLLTSSENSKSIEERQLDVLHSINQSLIQAFNLQGKVGDSTGIIDFAKKIGAITPSNVPTPIQSSPQGSPPVRNTHVNNNRNISAANGAIQGLHHGLNGHNSILQDVANSINGYVQKFSEIKDKITQIKFDGNLNISGVDFSSKDIAISGIVVGVLKNFADQLGSNIPSEAELKSKLLNAIKQLESNTSNKK